MGGLFKNWKNNPQSPVVPLREWVASNYECVPYYTDLAKCGVDRQTKKQKKILKESADIKAK